MFTTMICDIMFLQREGERDDDGNHSKNKNQKIIHFGHNKYQSQSTGTV